MGKAEIDAVPAGFATLTAVAPALRSAGYISNEQINTAVFLASQLRKPVLVEGPAGVGKTELAKTVAQVLDLPLIRLQCYEGLDESKALYEWKYGKQLLYVQLLKAKLDDLLGDTRGLEEAMARLRAQDELFFSETFLAPRPLLQALQQERGCVLLIDEVDKSDEAFEAFLLELLSEYQVSIPELGTVRAICPPLVFLTSNRTREMSEALLRRCLHLHIPYPDAQLEGAIVTARVPEIPVRLKAQLVRFVQSLRALDLKKAPAVSESIDWARALVLLHATGLDEDLVRDTLSVLLKFQEDVVHVGGQLASLLRQEEATPGSHSGPRAFHGR